MIEIDGSKGEGGGQILRTSLALSCVLGLPFKMSNIRAGRDKPGLRPQHLTGLTAAGRISGASIRGDRVGSTEIYFEPGKVRGGPYLFEVGTAGSVALVLHTVFLPLALCGEESRLKIEGGTHVDWSPPFDHLELSWARALKAMGINVVPDLQRAGFYPKGGGRIDVKISPCERIDPAHWLERGNLKKLTVRAAVANLPEEIARRMISVSRQHARSMGISKDVLNEEIHRPPCINEGAYFFLLAEFDSSCPPAGFAGLGRKGKRAEIVVEEAWKEFTDFMGTRAPIEPHLADQLLLPLAIAGGESRFVTSSVTDHLTTNAAVIEQFGAAKIRIIGEKGEPGELKIAPVEKKGLPSRSAGTAAP